MDDFEDSHLQPKDSTPLLRVPHLDAIESKEVVLKRFDAENNEPVVMDFRQTNLKFLSNQGRVFSPLEIEAPLYGEMDLDRSDLD